MKKLLILTFLFVFFSFVFSNEANAVLESENFLNNLQTCTSYNLNQEIIFDGVIIGKINDKCHVKYPNASLADKRTNKKISLNNCYYSTSDINSIVSISRETSAFYKKYLGKSTVPASEEARMKSLMNEYVDIHKKSCR